MPSDGIAHTVTNRSRGRPHLKTTKSFQRQNSKQQPEPTPSSPPATTTATLKSSLASTSKDYTQPLGDKHGKNPSCSPEKLGRSISFKIPDKVPKLSRRHSAEINAVMASNIPSPVEMPLSPRTTIERKLGREVHNFRRSSKDLAASISGLTQQENNMEDGDEEHLNPARQGSMVRQTAPPATRLSFLSVGRKVTNLLKFRNVAQSKRPSIAEEQVISANEIVEDLPKNPRFSSFMSAEAQYALLKGYEDKISQKLASQYPQCNGKIKRNKTPHHGIVISEKTDLESPFLKKLAKKNVIDSMGNSQHNVTDDSTEVDLENNDSVNQRDRETSDGSTTKDMNNGSLPVRKHSSDKGNLALETSSSLEFSGAKEDSLTPLENLRRLSLVFPAKAAKADDEMLDENEKANLFLSRAQQSALFPTLPASSKSLDNDRRLILSYRMESAMDMLDTLKSKYEHALSPRVKVHRERQKPPLTDYNRWADKWATEFKTN